MGIHPDFPFAHLYRIENVCMPEEVLCFLWYLCSIYTIGITFDIQWLYQYINPQFYDPLRESNECLSTFLTWFAPLLVWNGKLRRSAKATGLPFKKLRSRGSLNPFFNPHTIYFFHRPVQVNSKTGKIHLLPTLIHHNDFQRGVRPDFNLNDNKAYEDFQTHAFRLNNARQMFPIPFIPNWIYYPIDYQMSLDEDLQFFMEKRAPPIANLEVPKKRHVATQEEEQPQECPPEYFQDAQLPEDAMNMNIDEIGKMFNVEINESPSKIKEESEEEYECPDDHYGC
ncbi:hypothetical protein Bca52824_022925 [Brassica carinata]|uniref:Uncharacterized protein n=1 Tax=Brassica carinata TaxID=52824 RepID=A0A8X7VHN0_BRACI|nr:hypothetical protein Bca52824_022925 [Brassica carinata]